MKREPYQTEDYQIEPFATFPALLEGMLRLYGDKPALSWFSRRQEEYTLSYRELVTRVYALRESFCAQGLAGRRLAIVSENSADWISVFLASAASGSVAICIDTEQSDESIRDMLRRSNAEAVFLSGTYLDICAPLLEEEGGVERMISIGDSREGNDGLAALITEGERLLASGSAVGRNLVVNEEQTVELVFTSGTTSQSKMVMLSHKNVMQNCCDSVAYVNFYQRVFCSLPFYHAYGLNCAVINTFLRGAHLYINGDMKTVMRDLHLAQPDTMLTVPLMVETLHNQLWLSVEKAGQTKQLKKLLKYAAMFKRFRLPFEHKILTQVREQIVGGLRLVICGGAHLSKELSEEFELLGVLMLQGYGITECAPLISVNCNYANKNGSVGLPLKSCEVKVEEGEVWARGPSVMKGYYNDPEQTELALADGWFRTGDLGYLDQDGFLFLTGRKKNLIVFHNGKKISPETLEALIMPIPLVKEVMIYTIPSGNSVDDVKLAASIFPDADRTANLSSYEILARLQAEIDVINQDLPSYQQIQMIHIREKEFAKTGMKKIKRYVEQ